MTNPNNAVGTNGAFGGRTSVNAFNDIMGAFQSRGILSGWAISPSSGMTVSCGGDATTRDVAVAEDPNGNKTSINNISGAPINVTLDSAPASNSRYDAVVAYVDKPPMGNATQDNPECCGIIKVTGTAASTPSYPDDGAIRSAITADGASGASAYYVVLGYVLVASGTTSITSGMITGAGNPLINGIVGTNQIQNNAITTAKINNGAVTSDKIDWTTSLKTVTASTSTAVRTAMYFGDGTLITHSKYNGTWSCNTAWGSLYRGTNNDSYSLAPFGELDFISTPTMSITVLATSTASFIPGSWENATATIVNSRYAIPLGSISIVRPTTSDSVPVQVQVIAIGRWK